MRRPAAPAIALAVAAALAACAPRDGREEGAAGALPAVGVGVRDEAGAWCAAFSILSKTSSGISFCMK